jgi:hypothetical protein
LFASASSSGVPPRRATTPGPRRRGGRPRRKVTGTTPTTSASPRRRDLPGVRLPAVAPRRRDDGGPRPSHCRQWAATRQKGALVPTAGVVMARQRGCQRVRDPEVDVGEELVTSLCEVERASELHAAGRWRSERTALPVVSRFVRRLTDRMAAQKQTKMALEFFAQGAPGCLTRWRWRSM